MQNSPKNISFDKQRHPGIEFDIVELEDIRQRQNLDHNPRALHRVDFYIFLLITSGKGKHTIDFVEHDFEPGTVLTIRKDQVHKFHQSSAKGLLLLFTDEFMISHQGASSIQKVSELYNELFFEQKTALSKDELQEYMTVIQLITEEFHKLIDSHTSSIIRNLLEILLSKTYRKRALSQQVLKDSSYVQSFLKLQNLIEEKCTHSKSVQFYANELNITTKTLNNITQRTINKSCKLFIDEILILQIKRLLINSKLSIKQIAYQSGFDEPSNLFKFFKRYTNQTPESFRLDHITF